MPEPRARTDAPRETRPRVGVSLCLLGERVRYDGGHRLHAVVAGGLGCDIEWLPVCPEVEIGLGTPREPIRLEPGRGGQLRLVGIETRTDFTRRMRDYARRRVGALLADTLDGYVFKRGSPSCGLQDVPVADAVRLAEGSGLARGLFAEAVVSAAPDLPVIDEAGLDDPDRRREFVERVLTRARLRAPTRDGTSRDRP